MGGPPSRINAYARHRRVIQPTAAILVAHRATADVVRHLTATSNRCLRPASRHRQQPAVPLHRAISAGSARSIRCGPSSLNRSQGPEAAEFPANVLASPETLALNQRIAITTSSQSLTGQTLASRCFLLGHNPRQGPSSASASWAGHTCYASDNPATQNYASGFTANARATRAKSSTHDTRVRPTTLRLALHDEGVTAAISTELRLGPHPVGVRPRGRSILPTSRMQLRPSLATGFHGPFSRPFHTSSAAFG